MKCRLFRFLSVLLFFTATTFAQVVLELQPTDSVQTVLQRHVGQAIELRMKSGEKLGGKLTNVNEKLAHMSQLTGAEFFEAVVAIDDIAAVVVRAKSK